MERGAKVVWEGKFREGRGRISTDSGVLTDTKYSYGTRFEDEPGTNPEELVAAAHAACFSLALANMFTEAGYTPERIRTSGKVDFVKQGENWTITSIHLDMIASVPGIEKSAFEHIAMEAKDGCPISRLVRAPVSLSTKLESSVGEEDSQDRVSHHTHMPRPPMPRH